MADATDAVTGGGKKNKQIMYGAAGIAAAYVVYRWYRARSGGSAVSTATDAAGAAAGAGTGGAGGTYTNPDPLAGSLYNSGSASGSAPATDTAWTAAVEQDLGGIGYDSQTVAEAIAAYLGGQPLTTTQATIIRVAWAYEGHPPGHPNLPINTAPSTGGVTSATGTANTPTNFHLIANGTTSFRLGWDQEDPGVSFRLTINGHPGGTVLFGNQWIVDSGHAGIPIVPNTTYVCDLRAYDAKGNASQPASVTVHTTATATKKK
jgi:hypothetical protein